MWRVLTCVLFSVLLMSPVEAGQGAASAVARGKKAAAGKKAPGGKKGASDRKGTLPPDARERGCCGQHGGPCGCEKGAVKCCDGTASSLCGC